MFPVKFQVGMVYMLLKTQNKNINIETLKSAIISTAEHRETIDYIKEWKDVVEILENDSTMEKQWARYQKNNLYAEGIEYRDLIESLKQIGKILENY